MENCRHHEKKLLVILELLFNEAAWKNPHFILLPRQGDLRNSAQGTETDAKPWAAWSDQAKKPLRHCKVIINLFYASGHAAFSKAGLEMFRLCLCLQFIFSIFCLNTLKTFHCGCCKGIPAQKHALWRKWLQARYLKMQKNLTFLIKLNPKLKRAFFFFFLIKISFSHGLLLQDRKSPQAFTKSKATTYEYLTHICCPARKFLGLRRNAWNLSHVFRLQLTLWWHEETRTPRFELAAAFSYSSLMVWHQKPCWKTRSWSWKLLSK